MPIFSAVIPDPTSVGTDTASATAATSSGFARVSGGHTADYHAIDGKEFRGLRGFGDTNISRDCVGRMFLFHVGKDENMICRDSASIS